MGRMCKQCGVFKPAAEFGWKLRGKRLTARCIACRKLNYHENPHRVRERAKEYYHAHKEHYSEQGRAHRAANVGARLVQAAKRRARDLGIECSIRLDDVVVPERCPVLGVPLVVNRGTCGPDSPTLDRIDPAKGYVPGNVLVVSLRANTIKNNATPHELLRVASFYAPLYGLKADEWQALALAVTWHDLHAVADPEARR